MSINDAIINEGRWNILIVDDLYDSGGSMKAAANTLRTYGKVNRIYVGAFTKKRR